MCRDYFVFAVATAKLLIPAVLTKYPISEHDYTYSYIFIESFI